MTSTKLKMIALATMFIDHYGHFIPDSPDWMRWVGRVAAPIFIYCVVIGYKHTSNRKRYLTRLGIAAVGMSFLNLFINFHVYYSDLNRLYIEMNFFSTLFLIVFLIMLLEKKKVRFLIGLFVWQFVSFFIFGSLEVTGLLNSPMAIFTIQTSGNLLVVDGGLLMILLGILFYFAKENKWKVTISYGFYCLILFYLVRRWGWIREGLFSHLFGFFDFQWMMIFALPLLLLYNGKKGIGLKYFFYVFYPLHIAVLWYIGMVLSQ
ncbi:TraX family protein [Caldalkalibacillus salinus]|uniref:TraX family protein n=1 Tax=Caldalkalibacillus salinus TaxID=2803787 RepID=UPI00192139AD|nr:TraX family protein [Caldalkalibacillus salinus]